MQKYKQRKKVSKNQKLEPLVRHLLPKNTQLWLWRVRLWGSRSCLWWLRICLGNDDEIFINNSSKPEFSPTCDDEGYAYLHSVWDELNPPIPEQNIIGKYFGLIYYTDESRKKSRLFVGKVIRRFCQDAKGPVQFLEFECLKYASGTPTVLEKSPSHFDLEIDLIPAWDIICGPMSVTPETDAPTSTIRRMTSGKYFVPEYPNLVTPSFTVLKLDKEKDYERVYFSWAHWIFENYGKLWKHFCLHFRYIWQEKVSVWNKSYVLVLSFTFIWDGSRNPAASNMQLFVTIVNGWKLPTFVIRNSILDVALVLDSSIEFIAKCDKPEADLRLLDYLGWSSWQQ